MPSVGLAVDDGVLRSARMKRLLGSNEQPSEAEEIAMREARSAHQERLEEIEQNFQLQVAPPENLDEICSQIAENITKLDTVLHPMRRLPDDVLCEIFLACIDTSDFWNEGLSTMASSQPHAQCLTHVSRRWRQVSVALPRLWADIFLDLDFIPETNYPALLLGLQLERSRSCPLNVLVGWSRKRAKSNPLLPVLLVTSERWRTLTVIGTRKHFKRILDPVRGSLSSLQNLHIQVDQIETAEGTTNPVIDCFEFAPNLRKLRACRPDGFRLPWSQLSWCITLEPIAFQAVTQLVNVEICTINLAAGSVSGSMHVLPCLKFLNLTITDIEDISPLIDSLTLPALEDLSLTGSGQGVARIAPLLERSHAVLDGLDLSGPTSLDAEALLRILSTAPLLRFLRLDATICFTDSLVDRLTLSEGANHVVPSLCRMLLAGTLPCQLGSLVRMVQSRCQPSNDFLDHVELKEMVAFSDAELQSLRLCAARGLDFWNGGELIEEEDEEETV